MNFLNVFQELDWQISNKYIYEPQEEDLTFLTFQGGDSTPLQEPRAENFRMRYP